MRASVKITIQAWRDLDAIARYIARDNPKAAERFTDQLLDAAYSLDDIPLMGKHVRGRAKVRTIVHRPYLIFYRYKAKENRVEILHFWHGARSRKRLRLDS